MRCFNVFHESAMCTLVVCACLMHWCCACYCCCTLCLRTLSKTHFGKCSLENSNGIRCGISTVSLMANDFGIFSRNVVDECRFRFVHVVTVHFAGMFYGGITVCSECVCTESAALCFVRNRSQFLNFAIFTEFVASYRKKSTSELYGMSLAESQKFVGKIEMH